MKSAMILQDSPCIVRGLKQHDDDSSGNVAKNINLHPFKPYCVYLESLNLSNVGDFSWS